MTLGFYIDDGLSKRWEILGSRVGALHREVERSMIVSDLLDKEWEFIDRVPRNANYIPVVGAADPRVVEATRRIIEVARDRKAPPKLPLMVAELDADVVKMPGDYLDQVMVLVGGDLPLLGDYYRQFCGGDVAPKYVRVDSEPGYRQFRQASSPEMAELARRVAELEETLAFHLRDPRAHEHVQGALDDLSRLEVGADPARRRVPLSMPAWADGKWDCWREGDLVCCSISLPGADGCARICTSATPVARHVDDVVGYAREAGATVTEMLGVLPTLACMMGGGFLIPQMCRAAPELLARPEVADGRTFVGALVPKHRPSSAALIALLQRAQTGYGVAEEEWRRLASVAEHDAALAHAMDSAKARLLRAQGDLQ